jgi:hypothetical protein
VPESTIRHAVSTQIPTPQEERVSVAIVLHSTCRYCNSMHASHRDRDSEKRERESHCRVMSASQTYLACDISHEGKCSTMNLRTSSLVAAQRLAWYEPINKPLIIYVRHHSQSSVWASSRDAIRVAQHTQLDAIGLKDRWYPHPQVQPAHCTEKRFRPRT